MSENITSGCVTVMSEDNYGRGSPSRKDEDLDTKFMKTILEIEKRY